MSCGHWGRAGLPSLVLPGRSVERQPLPSVGLPARAWAHGHPVIFLPLGVAGVPRGQAGTWEGGCRAALRLLARGGASSWGGRGGAVPVASVTFTKPPAPAPFEEGAPRPCLGGPRGRAGSLLPPSTWWSAGGGRSGSECSCNPATDTAAQVLFYSDDDRSLHRSTVIILQNT